MTYFFLSLYSGTYITDSHTNLSCALLYTWAVAEAAIPLYMYYYPVAEAKSTKYQHSFGKVFGLCHQNFESKRTRKRKKTEPKYFTQALTEWLLAAVINVFVTFLLISLPLPFPSSADPLSLHQVWGLSEAGCVTQKDRESTDVQCRLHYVPGGASNGRHNSSRSLAWMKG